MWEKQIGKEWVITTLYSFKWALTPFSMIDRSSCKFRNLRISNLVQVSISSTHSFILAAQSNKTSFLLPRFRHVSFRSSVERFVVIVIGSGVVGVE